MTQLTLHRSLIENRNNKYHLLSRRIVESILIQTSLDDAFGLPIIVRRMFPSLRRFFDTNNHDGIRAAADDDDDDDSQDNGNAGDGMIVFC